MTNRDLLRAPTVAWPTVCLALSLPLAWGFTVLAGWVGVLPLGIAAGLATVLAYLTFTPMHDAVHRSVLRRRGINDALGRLAAVPLLAPYPAFRAMHLEHHKHTNEGEKDPDHWSGSGPALLLPLRWATQDLHYYVRVLRNPGRFERRELVEVLAFISLVALVGGACAAYGQGWNFVALVLIPARLATAILAFAFDYLPHRPHTTPAREDRFRATHVFKGRLWTLPFMGQNYHLIHHLYPAVPFYRYGTVWHAQREALLAKGARELPLLERVTTRALLAASPTRSSSRGPALSAPK